MIVLPHGPAQADSPEVTFARLLHDLVDLRSLAERPEPPFRCAQASSYDRASKTPDDPEAWFANRDAGNFDGTLERDGRTEHIMLRATGPGAIVRFWSANPKGTLRIYLDDREKPVIEGDMAAILGGDALIGAPFASVRSRGYNLYFPIPYSRDCLVTCDDPDGLYYQINHRIFEPSTRVESFSENMIAQHDAVIWKAREILDDPQVEFIYRSHIRQIIEPGAEKLLFEMSSAGSIEEIRFNPEAEDLTAALRACLLVFEFDGEQTACVPLGDFFASTPGVNAFQSLPITMTSEGEFISRWFMPFARSARVSIRNRGDQPMVMRGTVGSNDYAWTDRSMHFHAAWKRTGTISTRPRTDLNFVTIEGQGVFVGDALSIFNTVPTWWGEGDEKISIDRESFPSHFGTGTEDYYGYAWGNPAPFSAPWHTQSRCDGPGTAGFTSLNRFRLIDIIPFHDSLRFDMEIWHWAECEVDYATTTYFYARPGASVNGAAEPDHSLLTVPDLKLSIFHRQGAIEGEAMKVLEHDPDSTLSIQPLGDGSEGSWSGMQQLWCQARAKDQSVSLVLPVEKQGEYEVTLWLTRSWDYGVLQCFINGERAGEPIDTFNIQQPDAIGTPIAHSLGNHALSPEGNVLTIQVIGANPATRPPHFYWGLDCVELRAAEHH